MPHVTRKMEGILSKVEVLEKRYDGVACLSKITLKNEKEENTYPYFGSLTEETIAELTGQELAFSQWEKGYKNRSIYQSLQKTPVAELEFSVKGLEKREAYEWLRKYTAEHN